MGIKDLDYLTPVNEEEENEVIGAGSAIAYSSSYASYSDEGEISLVQFYTFTEGSGSVAFASGAASTYSTFIEAFAVSISGS